MPISTVIREKRKELGLTQEQLADRLGVTPPAVNKWEKGISCPDISILAPLARLLETDVNTLLYAHIYSQKLGKKSVDDGMEEYGRKVIPVLLEELKTGESYEFLRNEAEFQKLIQDWEKKIL